MQPLPTAPSCSREGVTLKRFLCLSQQGTAVADEYPPSCACSCGFQLWGASEQHARLARVVVVVSVNGSPPRLRSSAPECGTSVTSSGPLLCTSPCPTLAGVSHQPREERAHCAMQGKGSMNAPPHTYSLSPASFSVFYCFFLGISLRCFQKAILMSKNLYTQKRYGSSHF